MTAVMSGVLQREIMVAETVKGYPYSALPSLFAQQDSYSCNPASSCSSALMTQSFSSPPRQRIDMPHLPPHLANGLPHIGLGPATMMGSSPGLPKDALGVNSRKQREFIPENKKDDCYWDRRRRNNEAAKRSREKRRFNDMVLEQKVLELSKENHLLKAKINAYEAKFQIKSDLLIDEDNITSTMPGPEQILSIARRANFGLVALAAQQNSHQNSSLLSPNSLPSSPPSQNCNSSMQDDDQYSMTSYNQHQEGSGLSGHSSYGRSISPEQNSRDRHDETPQRSYSPEPSHHNSFYEDSSPGALNLSARSTRSPVQMEYCEENRSVDYSNGVNPSYLPHKLRHKNRPTQCGSPPDLSAGHHYQRLSSPSRSPIYSIKTEAGEESPPESNSSDDRDSGLSDSPPTLQGENGYIHGRDDGSEEMDLDNEQLRAHVERLSNEVHQLKHVLCRTNSIDSRSSNGILSRR